MEALQEEFTFLRWAEAMEVLGGDAARVASPPPPPPRPDPSDDKAMGVTIVLMKRKFDADLGADVAANIFGFVKEGTWKEFWLESLIE